MPELDRITHDPQVMGGRACIRGMRITVSLVLNLLASGMSKEEIVNEYPYLESDDIRQTLQYAAHLADENSSQCEQDDAWITEAINEVCAEVDTSMDPVYAAMQWASLSKHDW